MSASGGAEFDEWAMVVDSADLTIVLDDKFRVVGRVAGPSSRAVRPTEDAIGRGPLADIHPEDVPDALETLERVAARPGSTDAIRLRFENPDGDWILALAVVSNCRDNPAIGGLVIRLHYVAAEALDRADEPERTPIADIVPCGIDVRDSQGQVVYANNWLSLRWPGRSGATDWLDAVADRPAAEALIESARAGEGAVADLSFDFGPQPIWLRVRAELHRGRSGNVVGVVTTLIDVTEEIEARQQLERREQLVSATLASLEQGVLVIDASRIVTHANGAAHAHLGEPAQSLVGVPIRDSILARIVEADDEEFQTDDDRAVRQRTDGTDVSGRVVRYVHPDGHDRWLSLSTSVVPARLPDRPAVVVTIADVTDRHEKALDHAHRAMHDALTGLPNRAAMIQHLTGALARQRRRGTAACGVLFCDLDGFKAVNDDLGHAAGDRVLVVAADRIAAACRTADRVGRLGGDEFIVVLEDLNHPSETKQVAERLLDAFADPIPVGEHAPIVGISIGAAISDGSHPADAVIAHADAALYEAKDAGRGTWRAHAQSDMTAAD